MQWRCMAAICVCFLCAVSFDTPVGQREYVNITLSSQGRSASIIALRDTGNSLTDPVTGEAVLVISGTVAQKLTGLSQAQLKSPMSTIAERPISGLRLIPYRSVGNPGGMMLAMRFDNCSFDGKVRPTLVAFAPEGLGRGEVYQALTGGTI